MLKASHILVADNMLDIIQETIDWKINRRAYLFGSIAPDFNCVYPAHRINSTIRRFRKKVLRVEKSDSILIKSFTLGVITHYICDYFCYAHNIRVIDRRHPIYEIRLKSHLEEHEKQIKEIGEKATEELNAQWNNIKKQIISQFAEGNSGDSMVTAIKAIYNNRDIRLDYIIEAVNDMHQAYIDETSNIDIKAWHLSPIKMNIDMEYAAFMCDKVIKLIFEPYIELNEVAVGV